jgi:CBS domain-containing protein
LIKQVLNPARRDVSPGRRRWIIRSCFAPEDAMTNRQISYIVKDQQPISLGADETIKKACCLMAERSVGSVLVVDRKQKLVGIFTGRDAVRALAKGVDPDKTALKTAMSKNPITIAPDQRSMDALRIMWEGGFRHLPVVQDGRVLGVVSRGDFKGMEIDRLDVEQHLWETLR